MARRRWISIAIDHETLPVLALLLGRAAHAAARRTPAAEGGDYGVLQQANLVTYRHHLSNLVRDVGSNSELIKLEPSEFGRARYRHITRDLQQTLESEAEAARFALTRLRNLRLERAP
jgi:hypothetical protein